MTVQDLQQIERVPLAVDYRRLYRATAVMSVGERAGTGSRIEFSMEMSPWGGHEVSITFLESADYPLVPAIKLLKDHIKNLDRAGQLP
jgi:hypothetical protein